MHFRLGGGGGGGERVTSIYWDTGCAILLGYYFGWKINFWIYFVACNRFWVNFLAWNKFLGQVFSLE